MYFKDQMFVLLSRIFLFWFVLGRRVLIKPTTFLTYKTREYRKILFENQNVQELILIYHILIILETYVSLII